MAVDSQRPRTLYAGMNPAVWLSSQDGGDSWHESQAFRPIPGAAGGSLQPSVPSQLTCTPSLCPLRIRASSWPGRSLGPWCAARMAVDLVRSPARRPARLPPMAFHRQRGLGLRGRCGLEGGRRGQQRWRPDRSQPRDGLDRHDGWACAADPEQPEIWYVAASTGPVTPTVWITPKRTSTAPREDAGWTNLAGGLPDPLDYLPTTLMTDPRAPGHLYAGLSNGDIWFSSDHGDESEQAPDQPQRDLASTNDAVTSQSTAAGRPDFPQGEWLCRELKAHDRPRTMTSLGQATSSNQGTRPHSLVARIAWQPAAACIPPNYLDRLSFWS